MRLNRWLTTTVNENGTLMFLITMIREIREFSVLFFMEGIMQLTERYSPTSWTYWRMVLALAAKDIVDALKNKTTLTIVLGLAMVMLTVQALPLLLKLDDRPRVAIYDAARSGIADTLRQGRTVQVYELRAAEDVANSAVETSSPLVSVTLPENWENGTGDLAIDGSMAYWVPAKTAVQLVNEVEQALTGVTGRPVIIHTEKIYPTLENGGHTIMVALGLVLVTILITSILVPYLILEEKTKHTLELLRVSPVSASQIILGKGLAGTIYGILAAGVLLAFNLTMINLWTILLPAIVGIVLFGVGLGLLVGLVVENEGSVQMWVGLLAVGLLFPLMLAFVRSDKVPAWVQPMMAWLPTNAVFDLIRLSFGNAWLPELVWPKLTAVLVAIILVFALAGWRLRTWES